MLKSFRAKRRRAADLLRLLSKPKEGAFSFAQLRIRRYGVETAT
jgi:hypothetical protein